jgi:hypothetical protein
MKKLALFGLMMGVLSIGIAKAQSDSGQKQHQEGKTIKKAIEQEQTKSNKEITNYSLPFLEAFDGGSFPPTDWTTFVGSDGAGNNAAHNWKSDSDGYSGNCAFVLWENDGGSAFEDWMVSPKIDLESNSVLSFYEKQDYSTEYYSEYYIKISTNSQTNYSDFTTIESYYESDFSTNYSLHQVDLSAYAGQSVYIAFVMINDDGDSWYVDNVMVEENSGGGTPGGDLLISEVAYPYDGKAGRFVELYNSGTTSIDLTPYYLAFYKNTRRINLSGTIGSGETFVYAPKASDFYNNYGFYADQADGGINSSWFNGTDAIILLHKNNKGNYSRYDTYGVAKQDGSGTAWEYTDYHAVRKVSVTEDQNPYVESEWEISTAYASYRDVTPGNHNENYYWDGSKNDQWDEYQNWTVSGGIAAIPDAGANVYIVGSTPNDANLAYYQFPYYFNNLTVQNGGRFTMASNNWLKVKGDITIESGGTLKLESDPDGAAALITEGSISGSTEIERYFATIGGTPTNGKWHYFSPATSDLLSSTFNDQWLMYWDEPTTYWQYITATDEILTPGKGYGVLLKNSYGNTISMSGILNYGDIQSQVLHSTNGAGWQGWNLVGNPYPTPIDWEVVSASLPAGIDKGIHYWDSQNDQYVYYNNGSGSASQYIPPMQGFFIHVTSDNVQFTFPESAKTIEGADNYYKDGGEKPYVLKQHQERVFENRLVISSANVSGKTDKAFLEFNDKGTSDFDPQYDVTKFFSNNDSLTEIYLPYESEEYSVNVLNNSQLTGRYDLNIRYGINASFTLSFDGLDSFDANQAIQLYDKQMDEYYDLREKSNLEFYNDTQFDENRFEIVFVNYLSIPEEVKETSEWLVYSHDGKLNIKPKDKNVQKVFSYEIYSAQGKRVAKGDHISSLSDQYYPVSSGIYLVKIIDETHQTTKKLWLSN